MLVTYTLAWIPMVIIGILNGIAREFGYGRHVGELAAHQISSVTGVILFASYTWTLSLCWPLGSSRQALGVGLTWLGLTIAFEFSFGHYVAKHTWARLLRDYNILEGRLWSLVLATVCLAPYLVYKLSC